MEALTTAAQGLEEQERPQWGVAVGHTKAAPETKERQSVVDSQDKADKDGIGAGSLAALGLVALAVVVSSSFAPAQLARRV